VSPGPEGEALGELARAAGVPVECEGPGAVGHAGATTPRLEAGPLPEPSLEELVADLAAGPQLLVALDGVEDPQNLGAIARVAEAAGASGLVLTHRHAPPLSPAVSRASAGAIEWLPAARTPNLRRALNWLKKNDFWIFGADPQGTLDVFALPADWRLGRRVVVLGAEGRGLRPGVAEALDHRVRIPMAGRIASLNVATAAAVLLFELGRGPAGVGERQLRRESPN
jgi:23S rRNA (guanosine2251-2'-O)-methyltransferase